MILRQLCNERCYVECWTLTFAILSIMTAMSDFNIIQLFLKIWIQTIQSYNYVFQSIWDSQRAEIDSSERRVTTRWVVTQRNESSQFQLLGQTSMFFNYFWSIELSSIKATIMSFKVCEIVSAQKLIRARKELLLGERSTSAVNLPNLIY